MMMPSGRESRTEADLFCCPIPVTNAEILRFCISKLIKKTIMMSKDIPKLTVTVVALTSELYWLTAVVIVVVGLTINGDSATDEEERASREDHCEQ